MTALAAETIAENPLTPRTNIGPIPGNYAGYWLAQQACQKTHTLYVAENDKNLQDLAEALALFAPDLPVHPFPAWDCTPYDRASPDAGLVGQRLATLAALNNNAKGVILTTASAITQRVPPKSYVQQTSLHLAKGQTVDVDQLRTALVAQGYHYTSTVRETGEFAIRGGIVDIFIAGQPLPVRLDLFGDEVESLKFFDPVDQRSGEDSPPINILPVKELPMNEAALAHFRQEYRLLAKGDIHDDPLYEAVSQGRSYVGMEHFLPLFFTEPLPSLFDYLPESTDIILGPESQAAIEASHTEINEHFESRNAVATSKAFDGNPFYPLPVEQLYVGEAQLQGQFTTRAVTALQRFASGTTTPSNATPAPDFSTTRNDPTKNIYEAVAYQAKGIFKAKQRIIIVAEQESQRQRLLDNLRPLATYPIFSLDTWAEALAKPQKSLIILKPQDGAALAHGFKTDTLTVITTGDIFGERLQRKVTRRKAEDIIREAATLATGDLLVHEDHGIGRYEGLETLQVGKHPHDMVRLTYHGGDRLFVPVENIEVLSRFGDGGTDSNIDKLGGVSWQARKAKAKERIREIAGELLKIAAERAIKSGQAMEPDAGPYDEFCARFPYVETDDQLGAITDVLEDLGSGKPMDRLVCGDVGFGKTEVAMRAAFIAAMQGHQVVFIAPTTLLARQHYHTIKSRFAGFPIKLGHLSRLVKAKDAKLTKAAAADGTLDIIIGTHALLAKSMEFKRPGLIIVDEEQRFGVKQKERLKEFRADVHFLSLSATPIPRTLQMAMQGVRDLSMIATPPVDRLAIRTFVTPYDKVGIREALMREHFRGGQSFFICPRIKDLQEMQEKLAKLVPELKIVAAHGQMTPTQLEEIMEDFADGKFDVLLATQIVEAGIDVSNANTIIIHKAHLFGLAQLYQLRGRVGRGKIRAYALLLYPPRLNLGRDAMKRLEVMQTLDHLGAGFTLASHDLDIRGAGNLLGEEQSGHIREVGVELYQQMLKDAVATAQAEVNRAEQEATAATTDGFSPTLSLGLPVLLPDDYVPDLDLRMNLYRRAAELESEEQRTNFKAELEDRFGPLPESVENLLSIVALKALCRQAGVSKLEAGPKGMVVTFHQNMFAAPENLLRFVNREGGTVKLRPDQKLVFLRVFNGKEQLLRGAEQILTTLIDLLQSL